jgi:hypothetical protein
VPDGLVGIFHVAELDVGVAKDFDEFGDRAGIGTTIAADGDDLGREPAVPPLRGTLLVADGRDRDDIGGVDPQSFIVEGNWVLHGNSIMKRLRKR